MVITGYTVRDIEEEVPNLELPGSKPYPEHITAPLPNKSCKEIQSGALVWRGMIEAIIGARSQTR